MKPLVGRKYKHFHWEGDSLKGYRKGKLHAIVTVQKVLRQDAKDGAWEVLSTDKNAYWIDAKDICEPEFDDHGNKL